MKELQEKGEILMMREDVKCCEKGGFRRSIAYIGDESSEEVTRDELTTRAGCTSARRSEASVPKTQVVVTWRGYAWRLSCVR